MLYYPQLATGASAQFPIERQVARRTITNDFADGMRLKLDDPAAAGMFWTLRYEGLTDAERTAIEDLFGSAEGRLQTFMFLDPSSNLLRWSEDLEKPVWNADGMLQVTSQVPDGVGSERASRLTNTGQVFQGIQQKIDAPGWYRYCFSVTARASAACMARMILTNADGTAVSEYAVGPSWTRYACSGAIEGEAEDITCRFETAAGAAVEVFGFQLEAQPNSSAYRVTGTQSGVYPKTRFFEDEILFVANGIDDHAAIVRLYSALGGNQ
jgi:hypothetical protein